MSKTIKVPETLNLKSAKKWLKNKKQNIRNLKPKTKSQKKNLKNIGKTATLSIIAIPAVIDWKITFFIITNFLLFLYYIYFCKMIDKRNQLRIQKMKRYENKSEGIKKRMANLKQFKKPV